MIVTKQIREGAYYAFRILAIANRISNEKLNCPTIDFLQCAETNHPASLERLTALFDYTAENGPPKNITKFKYLTGSDQIYEFKAKPLRVFCFFDGSVLICTNGAIKDKHRTDPVDIEAAESWKSAYFLVKNKKKLIHEPEHT